MVAIKTYLGINGLIFTSLAYAFISPLIQPQKFPGFEDKQITQVESAILKKYQKQGYKDITITIRKESDYQLVGEMRLIGPDGRGSIECSATKEVRSGDIQWSCFEAKKGN